LPEAQTAQATPPATPGSRRLGAVVITLVLLPLVLPWPFMGLAHLWIGPEAAARWQECQSFDCPAALDLDKLAAFLVLGPSMLVAMISLLLGVIGLFWTRGRSPSPKTVDWFKTSVGCGLVWMLLLGGVLWSTITIWIYL
jgi:hypothetical protein